MREALDGGIEGALDRLGDMGLAALTRELIEPIGAAMIAKARPEMSTEAGAAKAFAEYWSFARALAQAFDEPQIASQAAAMFFSEAPRHCSAWCQSERVDGRERMSMAGLRSLAQAAAAHVDGNTGAFGEQLIQAMVARGSASSEATLGAAMAQSAPKAPKALAALRKDLSSSFIWPKDERLDQAVDDFVERRAGRGPDEALDGELEEVLSAFDAEAEGRGNHALAVGFCAKLACSAAEREDCLGLRSPQWRRLIDAMADFADLARHESGSSKPGLAQLDMKMLSSWRVMTGSSRERVASEIALAALERAGEPGGAPASVDLVGFLKEMFWGAGAAMGKPSQEKFTAMAQALCNRLCRDGASACLPLAAAMQLHGSMATSAPAAPSQWCALSDPETVDWMLREAGEPVVHGARWRELAALARLGEIAPERQAGWARAVAGWGVEPGEESMAAAVSAKDLAKGLGGSALGVAIRLSLDRASVPDGNGLDRLRDALAWLPELGASDGACARASDAMSEALAVLERAALEGAVAPASQADARPSAPRRRL